MTGVLVGHLSELKAHALVQDIQKMTSMTAMQIGKTAMGKIWKGAYADKSVFDADVTEEVQHQLKSIFKRIKHMVINGKFVSYQDEL